ncbi:tetratricopeptide repeat protein [bacterium]|nr:tetratricopeptide repeat protein [bacterium]
MNSIQYFQRGLFHYGKQEYRLAVENYEKALSLQEKEYYDETSTIYVNKAKALVKLMKYKEAIEDYTYAINYDKTPFPMAYYGRGVVRMKISDIHNAINDFSYAITYADNMGMAYYCRAMGYMELKKYNSAERDYKQAILCFSYLPPCALFFNGLGTAQYRLKKYDLALENYNTAIKIDSNFVAAYNNRGTTFFKLNRKEDAHADFKLARLIEARKEKQYRWQYIFDYVLPKFVDDIDTYLFANNLDAVVDDSFLFYIQRFVINGRVDCSELLNATININKYFKKIICWDVNNETSYRLLYMQVVKIMSLLHVGKVSYSISHYTSESTVKALLIDSSPLRLTGVTKANDEYEGKPLYSFLNISEDVGRGNYAYITCFSPGEDDHNMFRLYGKKEKKENSGFCLSFRSDFFNEQLSMDSIYGRKISEKLPLFRCVYMGRTITNSDSTWYVKNVGGGGFVNLEDVRMQFDVLKKIFEECKSLKLDIVKKIIDPLRYLIKTDSWQEERECRIVKIVTSDNGMQGDNMMEYINYASINDYIDSVYIGCNAMDGNETSWTKFIQEIKVQCPQAKCFLSRHKNKIMN